MKRKYQIISALLSAAMLASAIPAQFANAATVLTDCATGTEDGYNYELWKDTGNTTMTLTGNGTFTCEWNNINNCLFRTGKKFDCTQTYKEIGAIQIDYEVDYNPDGNSYLCVYGWTREPLVEYYIVDSWGSWRPPGDNAEYFDTVTVDGAEYDIYKTQRIDQPSIDGNTTFWQYWSVRKDKKGTGKISGSIDVSAHFAAWESRGLEMGKMYEAALNVEGYQSAGKASVLKNAMTVGGVIETTEPTGTTETTAPTEAPTAPDPGEDGYYFHSDFESGKDGWGSRGDTSVTLKDGALYVTGRGDSWQGTGKELSTSTFVPGTAYSFSVMAMQDVASSEEFKLTLQYNDASGKAHYDNIASAVGSKGEWVQLANESFTVPAGASDLLLYVETSDSTNDFAIDEAAAAAEGTKIAASAPAAEELEGDVNNDGERDVIDLIAMNKFLLGCETVINNNKADINKDGVIDVFDLALLKRLLLKKNNDPVKTEEPTEPATEAPARVDGVWYNTADVSWIDTSKPMVAIAFDDGPVTNKTSAERIQNAIADNGGHATFFYEGGFINSSNESEIKRAHELGFEIANHTWTHTDLSTLSADRIKEEIGSTAAELTRITGETDFLLRPPYLGVNDTVKENAGVPLITCAVDSGDWSGNSAQQIIDKITGAMNDGSLRNSVVLMHETYDTTAEAMEYLAPYLKEQGWQIVTVSELFKANGKDMNNGEVYARVY